MARKGHFCPFCHKEYARKSSLQKHLGSYTGEWCIPADGVHDVLQINKILDHLHQYKCGFCSTVFDTKQDYMRHALHRHRYWAYHSTTMSKKERGRQQPWNFILEKKTVTPPL